MVFPATALQVEIDAFFGFLPLVRDADVDAVHGARVVTRRLRETLPLFARSFPDDVRRVKRIVRRVGRRLGRVRELDVMEADLARRAARMPMAQRAFTAAQTTLASRQAAARKKLIKALDDLRLERSSGLALQHRRDWWRHPFDTSMATGWAAVLRGRIARRAEQLNGAIDHAGGVYFPKRLHAVRIAAKKLRYSAELAGKGRLWCREDALAVLKRTQDTLGRLHDADVLLKTIDRLVGKADVDERELALVKGDIQGEISQRHAKYLPQRAELRTAVQACRDGADQIAPRRPQVVPVLALSAAAVVPAGLLVLGARDR